MKCKLSDFIDFNPTEKLPKGVIATEINMASLVPFQKFISVSKKSPYRGGMKFRNGDTIMARITPCLENGKTAFISNLDDNEVGFGSTEYIVLRAKNEKAIPEFVYYLVVSEKIRNKAISLMTGTSGRQRVQTEGLMNYEVNLPDSGVQKKIVRILSALDSKIENNNEICANLEKQAEVLFKNWFIDFEPFKNDELVETDLGMIPKEWKIMPLGKIFDFRRGTALTKNDVSVKRDKDHPFVVYGAGRDVFGYSERYTINTPSVLIAAIGAGAGTVSRSYERRYSVTSNAFYVLPKNEFDYPYEIFSLRNYNFKDRCSGSAQPMLSYGAFSEDACVCPSANALKKFYDICSPMIKKIDKLMEQNNTLSSIRDALLPKLMNGEIDLEKVDN